MNVTRRGLGGRRASRIAAGAAGIPGPGPSCGFYPASSPGHTPHLRPNLGWFRPGEDGGGVRFPRPPPLAARSLHLPRRQETLVRLHAGGLAVYLILALGLKLASLLGRQASLGLGDGLGGCRTLNRPTEPKVCPGSPHPNPRPGRLEARLASRPLPECHEETCRKTKSKHQGWDAEHPFLWPTPTGGEGRARAAKQQASRLHPQTRPCPLSMPSSLAGIARARRGQGGSRKGQMDPNGPISLRSFPPKIYGALLTTFLPWHYKIPRQGTAGKAFPKKGSRISLNQNRRGRFFSQLFINSMHLIFKYQIIG